MEVVKLILLLLFGLTFAKNDTEDTISIPCTTFEGKLGNCVFVTKCKKILKKLDKEDHTKEELAFLRNSGCEGPEDGYVCCDQEFSAKGIKLLNNTKNFEACGTFWDLRFTYGREVQVHSRPWMALLKLRIGNSIDFGCAGTLIDKRFVLTAAHCINRAELIQVRLGEHNLYKIDYCKSFSCEKPFLDINIEAIKVHEDFNDILEQNDIALIKLASDVEYKEHIRPICLPLSNELREKGQTLENFFVIGWGWVDDFVPLCDNVYRTNCSTPYPTMNSKNKICASQFNSSCNGDAGGSLMYPSIYYGSQRYVQFGIISSGYDNCGSGKPAVYTNIVPFLPWISKNIAKLKSLKFKSNIRAPIR